MMHEVSRMNAAGAVILNTFDELEPTALDAMRGILLPPVYTIGPLSLLLERLAAGVPDPDPLTSSSTQTQQRLAQSAPASLRKELKTTPACGGWTAGRPGARCT
jgi:hypothetical protein